MSESYFADRHPEIVDAVFGASEEAPQEPPRFVAGNYVSESVFRDALETAAAYETNPITRFRIRRILRNPRAFARFHEGFTAKLIRDKVPIGSAIPQFDFQSILDYLVENWDEILKILLTIIPLFI